MMMRRQDADNLAHLVAAIRPDWDHAGILAALTKVRDRELPDVVHAAVRAASDSGNRTPAVIAMVGPHWQAATQNRTPQPPRLNDRCRVHLGPASNCPGCRADVLAGTA